MRTIAKHVARKPLVIANATDAQASGRNKQLRERFPARPAEPCWPRTDQTREDTIAWLTSAPFVSENKTTQGRPEQACSVLLASRWSNIADKQTTRSRIRHEYAKDQMTWVQRMKQAGGKRDALVSEPAPGYLRGEL